MNPQICSTCHAPVPLHAPGGFCPACLLREAEEPAGPGPATRSLEEIAAVFPQWEIVRLIGQGGMGSVYQVRQPDLDRMVALKILSPELGRDPAFAERFAREARVLGKLNHPNLVTVFEHGERGGLFYLLMEYVDGVNLRQAMQAGRFTPEQALAIVPGICDALQAAHAQGVWHRDIKPENILLDARGGVKIADFGIARIVGDPHRDFTLTLTGNAFGSAAYMAPEQHETPRDVDHRADIYSLGVVIYEMLTGGLPLGRFPAPSRRAAVSQRIDEIVFRTLEKERELRQQSADEVKADVQGAVDTAPRTVAKIPTKKQLHGKLALGLFLTGSIGLLLLPRPVVLPSSMGYVPAEVFFGPVLVLALVFGISSWCEWFGKMVIVGTGGAIMVAIAMRKGESGARQIQTTAGSAQSGNEWILTGGFSESHPGGTLKLEGYLTCDMVQSGTPLDPKSADSALMVHIVGNPVFMVVGKGLEKGFSSRTSGRCLKGVAGIGEVDLAYEICEADKATINEHSYDLTRGRTFQIRPNGTLRQIVKCPETVLSEKELSKFVAEIPSELSLGSTSANPLGKTMQAIIEAARDRNARVFQQGFSNSLKASMKRPTDLDDFGDFGNYTFSKATQLDATHAEVVVEANDGSKRRFTFPMILEDGTWKLNGWAAKH